MDLDELRKEIDAVDRQIVALFEKRMEMRDEKREQEKIHQVQNLTHTEFNRQHIEELYTLFISLSRKLQEELTKKS